MGKIEDMANAIASLSSDESGFITGEIMQVCGRQSDLRRNDMATSLFKMPF